jgi:DNA repair exonuclease SbcCD ATPase subunit
MSELRTHTFKIEWGGDEAKNGTIEFTRATRDAAAAEDKLREAFGKNAKVTRTEIKGKKELTREARRLITETNRQNKAYQDTVTTYKNYTRSAHLSADAQEIFNAQVRAGVEPLSEQGKEIARLVKRHQELRSAGDASRNSMRNVRGVAQNLGWQLQDTAVQLQMGTSAFTVLSQQGSQMASAFGPGGALVGALIAVGGAMAGVAFATLQTNKEIDELIKKQSDLLNLPTKTADQMEVLEKRIKNTRDEISRLESGLETVFTGPGGTVELEVEGIADPEKIKEQNKELRAQRQTLFELEKQYRDVTGESLRIDAVSEAEAASAALIENLERENAIIAKEKEQFLAQEEVRNQVARAQDQQNANDMLALRKQYNTNALLADQAAADEMERLRKESLAQEKRNAAERKKLADAEEKRQQQLTRSRVSAENQEIRRRQNEANRIASQISRSGSGNTLNPVEMEIQQNQERLTRLNQLKTDAGEFALAEQIRLNGLIEAEKKRHDAAMTEAEIELNQNRIASIGMLAQSMTATVDIWATGGEDIRAQMEEMNAAQKAMFFISQSIAAVQAFIDGVSLGSSLAAMFPLAAPQMIAFGTGVGAAQAGAIMGATIAGAFDKGGYIPGGQLGIVSEYGDELVNGQLVKGPARVTSREDTAKMMGGGNVYVYNQASDTDVSAQKDENGDTSIYVTKKELPSMIGSMAGDPNSKMNRNQNKLYKRERR